MRGGVGEADVAWSSARTTLSPPLSLSVSLNQVYAHQIKLVQQATHSSPLDASCLEFTTVAWISLNQNRKDQKGWRHTARMRMRI